MTLEYYPYYAPIILTDDLFVDYGGYTGSSTPAQRNAAYLIAEKAMTRYLNSFLLPTIVTGTYIWTEPLVTKHGHVISIESITVKGAESHLNCALKDIDACAFIRSDTFGYLDVRLLGSCLSACLAQFTHPYQVELAYNSGLPSGTTYQPDSLMGLITVAQIHLNAMTDPGANEGAYDIGIIAFANQSYREERMPLINTVLGNSAAANYAAKLVKHLRAVPALVMGNF